MSYRQSFLTSYPSCTRGSLPTTINLRRRQRQRHGLAALVWHKVTDIYLPSTDLRTPLGSEKVPQETWDQSEPDPDILELEAERERRRYLYHDKENNERIKGIGKRIRAVKAQGVKTVRMQYREYYFESRPTWDIEKPDNGSNGDMMGMGNADDGLDRPGLGHKRRNSWLEAQQLTP